MGATDGPPWGYRIVALGRWVFKARRDRTRTIPSVGLGSRRTFNTSDADSTNEAIRTAGWIAIAVLLATGVLNLWFRGWLRWDGVSGSAAFWSSATGHLLAIKRLAVVAMVVIASVHDFVVGPGAARLKPGSEAAIMSRQRAAWFARINALMVSCSSWPPSVLREANPLSA